MKLASNALSSRPLPAQSHVTAADEPSRRLYRDPAQTSQIRTPPLQAAAGRNRKAESARSVATGAATARGTDQRMAESPPLSFGKPSVTIHPALFQ